MGEDSAKAQQLSAPITNTLRMQTNRHRLYLLKDGHANQLVIGEGIRQDLAKVNWEQTLMGKPTYESVKPHHLAIDRPSSKFLCFLRKHYGLASTIPQVNNFVVFESFFWDRHCAPEDQELPWPFNQSPSLTRTNSLGRSPYRQLGRPQINHQEALRHIRVAHPQSVNGARETDNLMTHRRRTSTPEQQGMVAMGNMYSRYNKKSAQSPECVVEKSRPADSDQDLPGKAEHLERGVTSQPDQPTQYVPPLDLEGLTCDSDSNRKPPCAGDIEPPPAPRGPERPLDGQRDPKAVSPLAKNPQALEGPSLGKPEQPPHVGGPRDDDRKVTSAQQAQREDEAASLRGSAIPWVELGVSLSAQWIRRKHEFRNTRPW
ncbi:hypothetical protein scyTo_0008191 [Scyliorhinus torazame]|uniref:N-acetyltransferase domain-containing protein n=1 Tax=Scyliorhinus torazame TaxID=75743 RepID=A0A401P566_SCYTO|nr:hypothetical protein [Scyliorhinus torazame]